MRVIFPMLSVTFYGSLQWEKFSCKGSLKTKSKKLHNHNDLCLIVQRPNQMAPVLRSQMGAGLATQNGFCPWRPVWNWSLTVISGVRCILWSLESLLWMELLEETFWSRKKERRVSERAGGWERRLLGHLLPRKNLTFSAAYLFSTLRTPQTWNAFKEIKKCPKKKKKQRTGWWMSQLSPWRCLSLILPLWLSPPPLLLPLSQSN